MPLPAIAERMNLPVEQVRETVLRHKTHRLKQVTKPPTFWERYLSQTREERMRMLQQLQDVPRFLQELEEQFGLVTNVEDLQCLTWTVGELRAERLLPRLFRLSLHPHGNVRRMAYSAMGKLQSALCIPYLVRGMYDEKPQVRQYAVLAMGKVAGINELLLLQSVKWNRSEKDYIRRAAQTAIDEIRMRESSVSNNKE